MEKKIRTFLIALLVTVLLAACSSANAATPFANGTSSTTSGQPSGAPGQFGGGTAATATATAEPTAEPTAIPEPTATAVDPTAGAVQTAGDYFAALQSGDFAAASKLVSSFSMLASKLTASDVVEKLTQQKEAGDAWSNFQIAGAQTFDDQTVLVHVTYTFTSTDAKTGKSVETTLDEQWPFRLEQKKWKYNWSNIIDFETLSSTAKLANGLTVKPLQIARYSDKIRLTVMAQNSTASVIVVGGTTNQQLGTFYFGDQSVQAENVRYIFDAYRSYMAVTIDVKGLFTSYPDAVGLIHYINTNAAPWFTFALTD
jgi:hypothetical protein